MGLARAMQRRRRMKFEELFERRQTGQLSQEDAARVLGVSVRTFRRWEGRDGADGDDGLLDRRLDRVAEVLELYDTTYHDYTAKHFHEKLVDEFGYGFSYNWLRVKLQDEGRIRKARRRGAHRRRRPRKPMPGMLLHQDGSTHEWVPGKTWDLIWTMDDATSEAYSGFFVEEKGTMSSFRGLSETIRRKGLFCSLYVDRASHYWKTPEASGKNADGTPTGAELHGTRPGRPFKGMAHGSRKAQGGFWIARRKSGPALLAESAIDALSALSITELGHVAIVISTAGVATRLPPWIRHLDPETILCGYDADKTGDTAARRLIENHPAIRRMHPVEGTKDWNGQLQAARHRLAG